MIKKLFKKYSGLRYILASVAAFAVDNTLFYLLVHYVFGKISSIGEVEASTCAFVTARVLSSFFNFNCNYYFVFDRNDVYKNALVKYYCVCVPQALVSLFLLDIVIAGADFRSDVLKVAVKIVIEAILFVISYLIQNKWVFKNKKKETEKTSE